MKKRIWTAVLLFVLLWAVAAWAQADEAVCEHKEWNYVKGVASTCTRHGWEEYACKACGKPKIINLTIADHVWEKKFTEDPTCTEEGFKYYECKNCNATKTKTIDKLPHDYGSWKVTREATCTEKGERVRYCRDCGARNTGSIKMLPHPYGPWSTVREATDRSKGIREHSCTACGHRETAEFYPQGALYPEMEKNEAVKILQQFLIDDGVLVSRVDGDYGKKTEEAVKAYQRKMGYEPTGIAFPQTLTAIFCVTEGKDGQTTMTNNPHVYGDWTILTEAKNNAPGLRSHACLFCGFTAEHAYDPIGTLRPGLEKDEAVKELQKLLIENKIIKTVADGDYGPRTELGVSTFQQMAGLEVTGIAYPETIEALKNWNVK